MIRKLIQIIGPPSCGKTTLIRSLIGPDFINVNPLFYTCWNSLLTVEAKVCLISEFRVTPESLKTLRYYLNEDAIVIHRLNEEPTAIVNDKIWVYEGIRPIVSVESLIFKVEKIVTDDN